MLGFEAIAEVAIAEVSGGGAGAPSTPPVSKLTVRVTGYRGTRQHKQVVQAQLEGDISQSFYQPYEWSQVVAVVPGSMASVSSRLIISSGLQVKSTAFQKGAFQINAFQIAAGAPGSGVSDAATFVVIEISDGFAVRYEFNTPRRVGGSVNAGMMSPRTVGISIFDWIPGTTISFVDASVFP